MNFSFVLAWFLFTMMGICQFLLSRDRGLLGQIFKGRDTGNEWVADEKGKPPSPVISLILYFGVFRRLLESTHITLV